MLQSGYFPLRLILLAMLLASGSALPSAAQAQTPSARPRVAIVADGAEKQLGTLADLMTVALSQSATACELVERAELYRLAQEAQIQRLSAAERPRALARVAKADGLILLSLDQSDPRRSTIAARLSSVSSGLIHQSFMLSADGADIPTAAKLAAEAIRFPAERLRKAESAAPLTISLLGIRAAVGNSPGVAIETTLNAALAHHLTRIAGLAVAERWKLDDLAFERALTEKDLPPLATGTTLVDGSFSVEGRIARTTVRIRTAEKDPGKTINVAGPVDDAFALANNIATKVAAECGNRTAPAPWDARAEASAYAKLGGWLLNHKLGREAAQAYESAVALGDTTPETLFKRIFAYVQISFPTGESTARVNGFSDHWAFGISVESMEADKNRFPEVLARVSRAVAYAEDILSSPWKPYADSNWKNQDDFAREVIALSCRVLIAAHGLKLHREHTDDVAALRERTESLVKRHEKRRGRHDEHIIDIFAGYWAATPEQAVEHWLSLLKHDLRLPSSTMSLRRYHVANDYVVENFIEAQGDSPPRPLLVDWSIASNARGEACWRDLLARLESSPSLLNKGDAIALRIYTSPNATEREKLVAAQLELMEQNRQLLTQPQGQAVFYSFEPKVRATRLPPQFAQRYSHLLAKVFNESASVDANIFQPILSRLSFLVMVFKDSPRHLPRENAAPLLQAILGFTKRAQKAGQPIDQRDRYGAILAKIVVTLNDAYPGLDATSQPTNPAAGGNALAVRFLDLTRDEDSENLRRWIEPRLMTQCGDQILVSRDVNGGAGFVAIEPTLATIDILPTPKSLFKAQYDKPSLFLRPPLPTKGGFYMQSEQGQFLRYSYLDKTWTDESGLVGIEDKFKTIGIINGTVYVGTDNVAHTIGRVKDGKFELIASSRRRPAEHPLDALPPTKITTLFAGAGGRPHVLLATEVYDLDRKKKVASLPVNSNVSFSDAGPVIGNAYVVATIEPDSEKPRVLIRIPEFSRRAKNSPTDDLPRAAVWDWPQHIPSDSVYDGRIDIKPTVFGGCLVYLLCAHQSKGLENAPADQLSLLCFTPGRREPVEIPLTFQAGLIKDIHLRGPDGIPKPYQPAFDVGKLASTSAGLFFTLDSRAPIGRGRGKSPGILYVTWKDINDWLAQHGSAPLPIRPNPVPPPHVVEPIKPKPATAEAELLAAAERGDLESVKRLLAKGVPVDAKDPSGWTALVFAVKAANQAMVDLLIAEGASVDFQTATKAGNTPLHFCARYGNPAIMQTLLDHRAKVDGRSRDGQTALYAATQGGNIDNVKFLLSRGADTNLVGFTNDLGHTFTPLSSAAFKGHVELVKLLLEKGAPIESVNNRGWTALMFAAQSPHSKMVKFLLEKGANVNARATAGHTALIYAAVNGQVENIKLLLAAGADRSFTATDSDDPGDKFGRYSALDLAKQRGYTEAAALLLKAK